MEVVVPVQSVPLPEVLSSELVARFESILRAGSGQVVS